MSEYEEIGYDFEHTFSHTEYEGYTADEILQTLEEREEKINALQLIQKQKKHRLKTLAIWIKDDIIGEMKKHLEIVQHTHTRMIMNHHLEQYQEILKDVEGLLDE